MTSPLDTSTLGSASLRMVPSPDLDCPWRAAELTLRCGTCGMIWRLSKLVEPKESDPELPETVPATVTWRYLHAGGELFRLAESDGWETGAIVRCPDHRRVNQ